MIGYDYYQIEIENILDLFHYANQKKLSLNHLEKQKDGSYTFYSPIIQRYSFKRIGYHPIKSVGILYYLLLLISNSKNIFGLCIFTMTILFCTNYLFEIRIHGNNAMINESVQSQLDAMQISDGTKVQTNQQLVSLYDLLKEQLKQEIDYLNIYQTGSILNIEYTIAKSATKQEDSFENIIASKDGVIQRIEVEAGNVLVSLNQYVKKGEVLVSNTILSTQDEIKIIPVSGDVYAYTYQTVFVSKQASKDEGEDFATLLLEARNSLVTIDKIDKEIIIEYDIIDDKRTLEIQYVCIENIGIRGELDEEGN